jgi:hypothetical protein
MLSIDNKATRYTTILATALLIVSAKSAYSLDITKPLKIYYHEGETVTLQTKADIGLLSLGSDSLQIAGTMNLEIPYKAIERLDWTTMPGSGHMVKVTYSHKHLFISAYRFHIGAYFVIVNLHKTSDLFDFLKNRILSPESTLGQEAGDNSAWSTSRQESNDGTER